MQQHSQMPTAHIAGLRVECDDLHQRLIVRERRFPLGHLEYLLARRLVVQHQEWEARRCNDQFVSHAVLYQETGATSVRALRDLVSEARHKLHPYLEIESVRGKGYFLTAAP